MGVDSFEFWMPERRPAGKLLAVSFSPALEPFAVENLSSAPERPTTESNAWVPSPDDPNPELVLRWPEPQVAQRLWICCDGDYDHPMESVLWQHSEGIVPHCMRSFTVHDAEGRELASMEENHHARLAVELSLKSCKCLIIRPGKAWNGQPAGIFRVFVE